MYLTERLDASVFQSVLMFSRVNALLEGWHIASLPFPLPLPLRAQAVAGLLVVMETTG